MQKDICSTPNSLSQAASLPLHEVTSSNVARNDHNVNRAEEGLKPAAECQKDPQTSSGIGGKDGYAPAAVQKEKGLFAFNSNSRLPNAVLMTHASGDAPDTARVVEIMKGRGSRAVKDRLIGSTAPGSVRSRIWDSPMFNEDRTRYEAEEGYRAGREAEAEAPTGLFRPNALRLNSQCRVFD